MRLSRDDIEAALQAALPAPYRARAGELANLIVASCTTGNNPAPVEPGVALALRALHGEHLIAGRAVVSFAGAQTGDITIENAAGGDVIRTTVHLTLPPSQLTPHTQLQRRMLIERVRLTCVTENLAHLQEVAERIDVTLAWEPTALPPTAQRVAPGTAGVPPALQAGARISEVFAAASRSLLILGAPGAGKSTLLLELCRDLLARAEHDEVEPIPVILNLASWAVDRLSLDEWMVNMLTARPYLLPNEVARALVSDGNLSLLLDGLDEVDVPYREMCVAAINAYLSRHFVAVALTTRDGDYAALVVRPSLRRAVLVKPLDNAQIAWALRGQGAAGAVLLAAAMDDEVLRDLLRTPLTLRLATQAQVGQELLSHETWTVRSLLNAYIEEMFQYRRAADPRERLQALRRLRWVARRLQEGRQSVFYLEHLQSTHLTKGFGVAVYKGTFLALRVALLIIAPVLAILGVFGLGLLLLYLFAPTFQVTPAIVAAIVVACVLVILYGVLIAFMLGTSHDEPIRAVVGFRWSPPAMWSALRDDVQKLAQLRQPRIGITISIALVTLVSCGLLMGPATLYSLLTGLAGLVVGIPIALLARAALQGVINSDVSRLKRPNQGMATSIHIGLLVWSGVAALSFLVSAAAVLTTPAPQRPGDVGANILLVAAVSVWLGILPALAFGWLAAMRHQAVRLALWLSGVLPYRLEAFLGACADRALLRRAGGGYAFIHGLLQEHIAELHDADIARLAGKAEG